MDWFLFFGLRINQIAKVTDRHECQRFQFFDHRRGTSLFRLRMKDIHVKEKQSVDLYSIRID